MLIVDAEPLPPDLPLSTGPTPSFADAFRAARASIRGSQESWLYDTRVRELLTAEFDRIEAITGTRPKSPFGRRGAQRRRRAVAFSETVERLQAQGHSVRGLDEIRKQVTREFQAGLSEADGTLARVDDFWGGLGSFTGSAVGGLENPLVAVTLPLGGWGPSVAGIAARAVGVGMAVETFNQVGPAAVMRERLERDQSLGETLAIIGTTGLAAGVFEGGAAGIGRLLQNAAPPDALAGMLRRRAAVTGPDADATQLVMAELLHELGPDSAEAAALRSAWRQVLDVPEGEPTEVLAELGGEDIARMIVERGGWKQLNKGTDEAGLTVPSNRSLVKIIWKHGPKSKLPPELWVEERHIVALPQILRQVPGQPEENGSVRRVVDFADDRRVIFVERVFREDLEAGEPRRLITAFVPFRDQAALLALPGTRVDLTAGKATGGAGFGGAAETVLPATPSQQSAQLGRLGLAPDEHGPNADTGQGGYLPSLPDGQPLDLTISQTGAAANGLAAGGRGVAITNSGRRVAVQYELRELTDLIASHDDAGIADPRFPAALQPRARDRLASQAQIAEIAARLDPERLGVSVEAGSGAPIIGPDGLVESGNGRVAAIRRAYGQQGEAAARYRDYVSQFGDVSGFTQPVLVRRRTEEMDEATRRAFAFEANASVVQQFAPTERALADAALIDAPLLALWDGKAASAANRDFVRGFLARLDSAEHASMVDAHGRLSRVGERRIEAALLARAYGDRTLLDQVLEATDGDGASIAGGLAAAAPQWARMRAAAAAGEIPASMDQTETLVAAIAIVRSARAASQHAPDLFAQIDAFAEPDAVALARLGQMLIHPNGRSRSKAAIGEALTGYADEALKNTTDARLFGDPLTASELLSARGAADDAGPPNGGAGEVFGDEEALAADVARILGDGDMEVRVPGADASGAEIGEAVSARALLDEADADEAAADELLACLLGGGNA